MTKNGCKGKDRREDERKLVKSKYIEKRKYLKKEISQGVKCMRRKGEGVNIIG